MVECNWIELRVWKGCSKARNFTYEGWVQMIFLGKWKLVCLVALATSLVVASCWYYQSYFCFRSTLPTLPFFPTGSSLAAGRRVGSWVILTVCQVGRVYESQTLIGSWHCCQLAFWQTIRPYPSSEHLQIQRSGKVGIGNQGNHYYQCVVLGDFIV